MVSPRNVPVHPLSDYGPGMSAGQQFFIGRFEQSVTSRPNRLRFHRHTYYEAFLINGTGSYFADFREYCIAGPTLIFVSPGQVHRWNQKPCMTGPMICFTQEFYDGKEPPPSSLVDLPFWFPFETPPLLTLDASQARNFDSLWAEMEAEATPSKERDDIARALLRVLFYKAARIYRSLYEKGNTRSAEGGQSRIGRDFRLSTELSMEDSIMLIGQKIVVVGGTSGIGLAVARNAADRGAEVWIGSSSPEKLARPNFRKMARLLSPPES